MSDSAGHLDREEPPVGRLYREHAGWLLARLRRRFGEQAEDLVQEAYLRLAVAKTEVRHPRALLLTVAGNLARNQARGAGRAKQALSDAGRPPVSGEADQAEAILLKQIILGLPEPLRSVERVIGCYLALSAGRSIRSLADCAPRQAVS